MFTHADTTGNFNGLCGATKEQNEPFILIYKSDTKLPESVNCPQCIALFVPAKPKKTLSSFRQRLNKAHKLQPVLCTYGINGKVYGMRSTTDQSVNYQVRVVSSRSIAVASNKEKIAHSIYTCTCQQVGSPDMHTCKGSEHTVCYHSLASVRKMAQDAGKKVVFCRDMKNALLKRKIYKGALIEVKSGSKSVYGIAY